MSLVVRVLAPVGRDADLITKLLCDCELEARRWEDTSALPNGSEEDPLGPLIIAEEALNEQLIRDLGTLVAQQPAWSDLPILVLTSGGRDSSRSRQLERDWMPLGSPILLERPIRPATLRSSVQAAVRARKRQYEMRDALAARDCALTELKSEQETLQTVLDNLPVGVLLARPSGRIVLANRSVETILKHPMLQSADIESYSQWSVLHADGSSVPPEEYPLARVLKTGVAIPPEDYLYRRGDGVEAWIRLAAAPIIGEDGAVAGGLVAISDIDHQKRADEALRRSDERFRRIIENGSIGIILGDFAGGLSYVNATLLNLLGYTAEDVHNGELRWSDITPNEFADADMKAIEQMKATGVAQPYQKQYRARDGRLIPLLLGAMLIPAADGETGKQDVAVFLTDLTTQKQAEAALIQSEKIAAVGRLAASISHEINNPLEAVTNLLYIARNSSNLVGIRERLDHADRALARVSQLVTQTLQFHPQSTRPRLASPDELVDSALTLYHGRFANFHVSVDREQPRPVQITCYESDVRQVLNNLVGNAVDAMRSGALARKVHVSPSPTPGTACRRKCAHASSRRFTPLRATTERVLACGSRKASWKSTGVVCRCAPARRKGEVELSSVCFCRRKRSRARRKIPHSCKWRTARLAIGRDASRSGIIGHVQQRTSLPIRTTVPMGSCESRRSDVAIRSWREPHSYHAQLPGLGGRRRVQRGAQFPALFLSAHRCRYRAR